MVETAKYERVREIDEVEIRRYPKLVVATVGNPEGASRFNLLFRYISGENRSRAKLSMTTPVITQEKIDMTAPVISDNESMSFVLPSKYSISDVPESTDSRVQVRELHERYVATLRFRGLAWKTSTEKHTKQLLAVLERNGISVTGQPVLMQYNSPWTPGFMRRNEVGVEVDYRES